MELSPIGSVIGSSKRVFELQKPICNHFPTTSKSAFGMKTSVLRSTKCVASLNSHLLWNRGSCFFELVKVKRLFNDLFRTARNYKPPVTPNGALFCFFFSSVYLQNAGGFWNKTYSTLSTILN